MTDIFINSDLFIAINDYTNLRNLCDTCLSLSKLKIYINYVLKRQYSLMYYNNQLFRNIILNKIFNPSKQLQLNLSFCNNITNITALENVHNLDISYCYNITNITALENGES